MIALKRRGDADYMDTAIGMVISVVLGMLVLTVFVRLVNTSVLKGMQNSFAKDPSYTVSNATFNIRTDSAPTIVIPSQSQEAEIKSFYFQGIAQKAVINDVAHMINITVLNSTDVSSMIPSFVISDKASISYSSTTPISGQSTQNFSASQIYTVTAESGRQVEWLVSVTKGVV